jgi:NADH dehydrogenase FAD-containing subunit
MNATETTGTCRAYDVVILGAGYAGLMAALRLGRKRQELRIALISASDRFLERVRLQESIVTEVVPRISSISAFLAGSNIEFICGRVTSLNADQRCIRIVSDAQEQEIMFDEAIYALGSRVDVDGVPGAAEHAYRLEAAEGPRSPSALRTRLRDNADRPLRVITVGGAETAVEVAGEIKTAWPGTEMTMISSSRCGDFKGARVESAVRTELARLGVRMIDGETVAEVHAAEVVTDGGRCVPFDVCV